MRESGQKNEISALRMSLRSLRAWEAELPLQVAGAQANGETLGSDTDDTLEGQGRWNIFAPISLSHCLRMAPTGC